MSWRKVVSWIVSAALVSAVAMGGWMSKEVWIPWLLPGSAVEESPEAEAHTHGTDGQNRLALSEQAKANLKLRYQSVRLQTYWRKMLIPGTVIERPGRSNRGVTATLAGVVSNISVLPGDSVQPGDTLCGLRLVSEPLQTTQAQLYRTMRDLEINVEEQKRLQEAADAASLFRARLLELGYEQRRLQAAIETYGHDLTARGLSTEQIAQARAGKFVTETVIRVPSGRPESPAPLFEVEELKVQVGDLVQVGQTVCTLADHQGLEIEGRAFEAETPQLRRASKEGWPLSITVLDDREGSWPTPLAPLPIRLVANHVDPVSRTFAFYLSIANEYREEPGLQGKVRRIWRFRPGQRVRLGVPVEKFDSVFVLPSEAVVREGPNAYVFRVNGKVLDRKSVHLLLEHEEEVVLSNDGSISPGNVISVTSAAQLNRALKTSMEGGEGHGGGHSHEH
jgi:multidrug efflux pump subunit AcrA (membrane-fusion protein)